MSSDVDTSLLDCLSSLTLLCVEDNKTTQLIYHSIFKNITKRVIFADNGKDGFEIFKTQKIDIIITDYEMPNLNGIEMIKLIRELDKDIPIILVSAVQEIDIIVEALKLNVNNFLKKPIILTEVIQAVEKVSKILIADNYLREKREKKLKELETKGKYNSLQEELAFAKELNIIRNDFYYQMHENSSIALIDFFYKPLDVLSGDSYSAREIDKNMQLYFIIDGMGKGLSASLSSMLLTSYLNHLIDKRVNNFDFKSLINSAVEYIKPVLLEDEAMSADFMLIDYKNSKLHYAKFAMPSSLLQTTNGKIVKIKSNNAPLSKYIKKIKISSFNISNILKFLFYSDGVVENSIREKDKTYANYLQSDFLASFTKDELREKILWRIDKQEDDMTFIFINRFNLMKYISNVQNVFDTSLDAIEKANEWYGDFWSCTSSDYKLIYNAGVVFNELFMNAYEHGNLGLDAQMKHKLINDDNYFATLEKLEKTCNKKISVCINIIEYNSNKYVTTAIRDEGAGFDTQILSDIFRNRKNFNGRGVYISRQASLGIYYNTKGTSVLFLHKLESEKA
ncbi:MAG: response regulator [Sulfurimonas denitrificans]|nr:response regulator [Sulfurimonas denitrificans]